MPEQAGPYRLAEDCICVESCSQAPPRPLQGLWLGATAVGNLMLWVGPLMYNGMPLWQCWGVFLVVCVFSMSVMLGMVKWLERVTK